MLYLLDIKWLPPRSASALYCACILFRHFAVVAGGVSMKVRMKCRREVKQRGDRVDRVRWNAFLLRIKATCYLTRFEE